MEEVSCVLVLRNRKWFEDNISQLEKIWNIILKERETGYDHRASNRRVKKVEEPENNIQQYFNVGIKQIILSSSLEKNGCLINVKGHPNKSYSNKGQSQLFNENIVIRVRTQSMDETKQSMDETK